MNPVSLSRASLALLILAVLAGGVALGSALPGMRGTGAPSPSQTAEASSPRADALPQTEAVGEDLARLPRYPGSVRSEYEAIRDERVSSVAIEYLAEASVDEVRAFYQGVIVEHGWQRADIGYSGAEWTYVLVDARSEALVEIEETGGLVEIDLQLTQPISTPTPEPTVAPTQQPAPPPDDDGGDDDGGDDGDDDDAGTDD